MYTMFLVNGATYYFHKQLNICMVTKLPYKLTKGHTMSTTTEPTLPITPQEPITPSTVCQPGDTECNKRLVEAFSDCD